MSYLSHNMVVGTAMAQHLQVLPLMYCDYALLRAPGAPLKQALLDAGLGKDVYGSYEDGIRSAIPSVSLQEVPAQTKKKNLYR